MQVSTLVTDREWCLSVVTVVFLLFGVGENLLRAAPPGTRSNRDKSQQETPHEPQTDSEIRLHYMNVGWNKVLKDLSETTGMPLVADRLPSSKYTRRDKQKYDLAGAMKILNQDLEKNGFRLIRKGNYLVVVDLPAVRTEYPRPTVGTHPTETTTEGPLDESGSAIQRTGGNPNGPSTSASRHAPNSHNRSTPSPGISSPPPKTIRETPPNSQRSPKTP